MADNTILNSMTGGDTISSDDLTTLNGAASGTQKVQRMKVGFGPDGTLQDVTSVAPLPVSDVGVDQAGLNITEIGGNTIATVEDGVQLIAEADEFGNPLGTTAGARDVFVKNQKLPVNPTITPDAQVFGKLSALNQKVDLDVSGYSTGAITLTGTWSATVAFQTSLDGVSFGSVAAYSAMDYISGGSFALSTTSNTTRNVPLGAAKILRVTSSAFTSGIVNVELRGTLGVPTTQNTVLSAMSTSTNNYLPVAAAIPADGLSIPTNSLSVTNFPHLFNNSNYDRTRSVINATNSTGTGIAAAGILAQLDDTSPTAITENQFGNVRMSADHSVLVAPRSLTPTQTSVAGSATSVSLLAANNARKGATFYNDSTAILYLKMGATASATSFSTQMQPNDYYELPFGYVGAIDGIWAAANGNCRITELA